MAEVDGNNKVVKFVNVVAANADYIAATNGTLVGNAPYATIAAFNAALGDASTVNKTLVLTVDGVDETITFNANYSGAGAFADWAAVKTFVENTGNLNAKATFTGADATGLKFTSATTGAASKVIVKTDASSLLGATPVAVNGVKASN